MSRRRKTRNVRERQAVRYVRRMPMSLHYKIPAGTVERVFGASNRTATRNAKRWIDANHSSLPLTCECCAWDD